MKLPPPLHACSHGCYSYFQRATLTPSLPPQEGQHWCPNFQAGAGSPSPSNPGARPSQALSVFFQHPAELGELPLSFYNLYCEMALWESRWVKKQQNYGITKRTRGAKRGSMALAKLLGSGGSAAPWQLDAAVPQHVCLCTRLCSCLHHSEEARCKRRLPQGIKEKPEGWKWIASN